MDKNKNILLITQVFFRLSNQIIEELERQGYNVSVFEWRPRLNFFTKILFYHVPFMKPLMMKKHTKRIIKETKDKQYDLVFFCSPVFFSEKQMISLVETYKNTKKVYFMWDSLRMYPVVKSHIKHVDKFYSFDLTDCKEYSLEYQGDFSEPIKLNKDQSEKKYDLIYLGTATPSRFRVLKDLSKYCVDNNITYKFVQFFRYKFSYIANKILHPKYMKGSKISDFVFKPLNAEEKDNLYNQGKVLVDVTRVEQNGLTNRCVDALTSNIKIITNNANIAEYDLYNKNNVAVFSSDNYSEISKEFIEKEFEPIDQKICESYSLKSFIDKIVNSNLIEK